MDTSRKVYLLTDTIGSIQCVVQRCWKLKPRNA